MDNENRTKFGSLLKTLPPVEFCCMYGSSLHPHNNDKSSMVDYILGVSNPQQWHTENLKLNKDHYASLIMRLGGARLITDVADDIGVGVHFNPFVTWEDKMYKYGVVRMDDLIRDILEWKRFYLSGRLQKPVRFLVDNLDIENVNSVNLKGATSAALLLLPSKFTEVKKIVQGQFNLIQTMYKSFLEEYATKELLRFSSSGDQQVYISQSVRSEMGMKMGKTKKLSVTGQAVLEVVIGSREEAAECMRKVLRNKVMASSAGQAVAGLFTVGVVHGSKYLVKKMNITWKSWT